MKRSALKIVSLSGLLTILVAGGWWGTRDTATGQQQQTNATMVPFTAANDVQFIDAIIPHHEMAVRMADLVLQKGTRAEVKTMAQTMKEMQQQEIAVLQGARQALTGSATVPTPPTDAHMEADHMLLEQATGAQVDSLFLEHMIPHHAEAISLAHRALPNLQRADVRQIATNVVGDQAKEIGEMQELRDQPAPQQ